ncbi:Sucrase/ferredoxin-like-domain-containing protein [Immersiella caudata]|uniref:Altered inheritance of mitochondria protein 32 n=1 Tax=Immersiella caudata TaxID=314043 RepID=A0AA39X3X0_9PEZI|nr:Sucrase/ferredoxin-like-domain-containing protein [Immersiella caudata]
MILRAIPLKLPPWHRLFSTKSPPFPVIATCPSPTSACAPTPTMPSGFEIDHKTPLNGLISNYAQQVLICTGKDDWPSKIEDDNSGDNLAADLKELVGGRGAVFSDPFHNISILNSSFPSSVSKKSPLQTTSAYLLPSFKYVPFLPRVSFDSVEALVKGYLLPEKLHVAHEGLSPIHRDRLTRKPAYRELLWGVRDVEDILVLVCGHGGRDQRCGVFGPLLKREFEEKLGGVGVDVLTGEVAIGVEDRELSARGVEEKRTAARVGLISHIGGHKFAGNVICYLPPELKTREGESHPLAGCGIWFGRVEPKHVEGIVRETILKGNVIEELFRGGIRQDGTIRSSEGKSDIVNTRRFLLALGAFGLVSLFYGRYAPDTRSRLDEKRFVPFVITHKEKVSNSAFILTVAPRGFKEQEDEDSGTDRPSHQNRDLLERAWNHGLWSVEIKQPQIQVSRDYTPLPPASSEVEDTELRHSKLRFLIRKIDGGEVSTYLSRLQVGDTVELRGPHLGFDVRARLGTADSLVFLAGGTGIAPALQAARALLNDRTPSPSKPSVSILWANRHRDDCPATPSPQQDATRTPRDAPNAMTSLLCQLKSRYGNRLTYASTVDDEGTFISDRDVLIAAQKSHRKLSNDTTLTRTPSSSLSPAATPCTYHSASALPSSPGHDATLEKNTPCGCIDANGSPLQNSGKNLLVVSGPEGFINHFAGPKLWAQGTELQGPLGGVAARLWASNPKLWENWLVLKL